MKYEYILMDKYVPEEVYNNLIKLFSYRNATITTTPLSKSKLTEQLNHHEYVMLEGRRTGDAVRGDAHIIIIMIAGMSKYSNKSAEFAKLFKIIPKSSPGIKTEVIFISENKLTRHIIKKINKLKPEMPEVHIESYDYGVFKMELPKHVLVPKHVIADPAEVSEFCDMYYTMPEKFPRILSSDPQAVWIGLRPGMVCRIERVSETAGTARVYKLCIQGDA